MQKYNILIFPCGSVNALEIHTALKDCFNINVFGGTSRIDHGAYVFKNYITDIPFIDDPKFIDAFNETLEKNEIDIVFPTHDTAVLFFAKIADKIKTKLAVPGLKQADICRYKNKTYDLFSQEDFCPKVYSCIYEIQDYPVFVKPVVGEGGRDTRIIHNKEQFKEKHWQNEYLVVEYLPGDELTVDCFTDRFGQLKFAGPRSRNRIFSGVSVNSFAVPLTPEIIKIAEKINDELKLRGLWFFQVKKDKEGKYKLMEISVRTAGTMTLYRNLGVNFPLLTVYDLLDRDIDIIKNNFYVEVDRALFNRYKTDLNYSTVYIDFDDTITKRGAVNPFVMMYLFGERNKGKTIKVLTRHQFDFQETLNKLSISRNIFDEVIHITWDERKYHYIKETEGVIFIDNAYQERAEVKRHLNIPVFDVDAIQCLIDWRE